MGYMANIHDMMDTCKIDQHHTCYIDMELNINPTLLLLKT